MRTVFQGAQQRGADEKSAEHKENIDTRPAISQQPGEMFTESSDDVRVKEHHPNDRGGAKQIEAWQAIQGVIEDA
jgi:hypothetical protein